MSLEGNSLGFVFKLNFNFCKNSEETTQT